MTDTPDPAECQRKAEALLREAAQTVNLAERSRLIDQAVYWHLRGAAPRRDATTHIPISLGGEDRGDGPRDDGG
jgi:hypothetical protein